MKNNRTNPKQCVFLLLGILAALIITGCSPTNTPAAIGSFGVVPVNQLSFPMANYYSIIFANHRLIALAPGENVDNILEFGQEGDQRLSQITFPADANCNIKTAYNIFSTFPDGQVQLWKLCFAQPRRLDYLLAYNWQTHVTKQITGPLPVGTGSASWNPEGTRAIVYLDDGFASGVVYWIWNGGFGPADLEIVDDGRSWNLKDDFPDFKGAEAGTTGNTGRAAWSPNGKEIAFFASPDAIGKTGLDRESKFKLYRMDVNTLQPQPVVDAIYSPFVLAWSPDSKKIAFIGDYGFLRQGGIWLYSSITNSIIGIAKGDFRSILWTEDGKGLIAIQCKTTHDCSQIEEYDLSGVLTH